jgi:hypothetical protein
MKQRYLSKQELLAAVYAGLTYAEIAKLTGLSRRYINCLAREDGLLAFVELNRQMATEARVTARKDAIYARMGCSYADYKALPPEVKRGFQAHRRNARQRGVPWGFNLWDWWGVWLDSGKWEQRGRGRGQYVMARHGDEGAYRLGNVSIITGDENKRFACSYRPRTSDGRMQPQL